MKRLSFLLLLCCTIFTYSCQEDDLPLETESVINYDGDNFSGPLLEAGQHEFSARFLASQMSFYEGQQLTHLEFFMGPNFPAKCEVRIYGANNSVSPGTLLYSKDVTNNLKETDWNKHELDTPLIIPSGDLWLTVAVEHATLQQSVGCDSGPADPNGDWLFQSTDNSWERYSERTPESVNWNIRGTIVP